MIARTRHAAAMFCAALPVALLGAPAHAQRRDEPKRPKLDADADTNDAQAYYSWGMGPRVEWKKAHDGFYWAFRLEPRVPLYLYAQWLALWYGRSPQWRSQYAEGAGYVVNSKEAKQLDSLYNEVLLREPFAHIRSTACHIPREILEIRDPLLAGLLYYERRCYTQAEQKFGEALEKKPERIGLHFERARLLYFTGRYAASIAQLQVFLDSLRRRETEVTLPVYQSKEMLEYMIAAVHTRMRNWAAAREALGRALTENLAFYMGHASLGEVAREQNALRTAATEFGLAVDLKPDDAVLRYEYGTALADIGELAQAEAQLRKAVELEPYFAQSYFDLAEVLDKQDKAAEAIDSYRAFLARVPRRVTERITKAQERIAALEGT